jgi:hypothetical protein
MGHTEPLARPRASWHTNDRGDQPASDEARKALVRVAQDEASVSSIARKQLIAAEARQRDFHVSGSDLRYVVRRYDGVIREWLIERIDDVPDDLLEVRGDFDLVMPEPVSLREHARVSTLVDER